MMRAFRSELVKLLTLRSILWSLVATAGVATGFTYLVATSFGRADSVQELDPIFASFYALTLAQLAVVTFGALAAGQEYSHHTIRTSLLATPRRGRFYLAKALAVGVAAGVVSLITVVACHGVAQAVLGDRGVGFLDLDAPRAMLGGWLYLVGIGLFAMGVATSLRSTAGALGAILPLFLLGSQGLGNVPGLRRFAQFLPDYAGTMIFHTAGLPEDPFFDRAYGPWLGMGILALWVVAALAAGYTRTRRDV